MLGVREELKLTDELAFLDKRNKQLSLNKEQKENLKSLNREMEESQKPIFKDIEFAFNEIERTRAGGIGVVAGRGAGIPQGIRESMVKLAEIQMSYAARAYEKLTPDQKLLADSLRPIYLEDLREQAEKKARARSQQGFVVKRVERRD